MQRLARFSVSERWHREKLVWPPETLALCIHKLALPRNGHLSHFFAALSAAGAPLLQLQRSTTALIDLVDLLETAAAAVAVLSGLAG